MVLAFATGLISSSGGTKIDTFGGQGTTGASLTRTDVGLGTFVFTGAYPAGTAPGNVTVLASAGMGYVDQYGHWLSSTAGADVTAA